MGISGYIEQFQWALRDEIKAIRDNGGQKTYINDGKILGERNGIYLYSFTADSEIRFPDDTPVDVELKGKKHSGWIISIEGFDLIIGLEEFIGSVIPLAVLYTAPWFLLEELQKRFTELESSDASRQRIPTLLLDKSNSDIEPKEEIVDNLLDAIFTRQAKRPQYNTYQLEAITKVFSSPISFIWGPPGTGKTSTLGLATAVLLESTASVLILAHSNVAVDVAMLSLMNYANKSKEYESGEIIRYGLTKDPGIEKYPLLNVRESIRLSSPALYARIEQLEKRRKELVKNARREGLSEAEQNRIKDELVQIKQSLALINAQIREAEKAILKNAKVVGCTLSKATIAAEIFGRRFDAVLVDEASMAYIPHCVFSASLANQKIGFFGDFRQLAPISQADTQLSNLWLKRDIFDESGITQRVNSNKEDQRLVLLKTQYRMHSNISKIPNTLFYQNRLEDGNSVNQSTFPVVSSAPLPGKPVALLDTSNLPAMCFSENESHSRFNFLSALISVDIAVAAAKSGRNSVGIVTPFSAQARLVNRILLDLKVEQTKVKVATVHKFQGSEQDIIVFESTEGFPQKPSLLINQENDTADRLANVAISRARGKFLLIANRQFIQRHLLPKNGLRRLVDLTAGETLSLLSTPAVDGSKFLYTDLDGIQFFASSETIKANVEHDLSAAKEEIAINWPEKDQRPYFSPYAMKVCDPSKVRFFFTGDGNQFFNIGLRNSRCWHGINTPKVGLVGVDRKVLWIFLSSQSSNGMIVRLLLPKLISLLYGFWHLVPEEDLIQGTITEKIEAGNGPIGLPCPQCKGLLWLELGRYGVYLACTNHCGYTRKVNPGDATQLARLMGKTCELCGGQVIGKRSYDGIFLGCVNYPLCRWTIPLENLI